MFKCEFCNKDYTTKTILNTHQKTAKKCLALRGENTDTKDNTYKCDVCEYTTRQKGNLAIHISSCKTKISQKYSSLERDNARLEKDKVRLENEKQTLLNEVEKLKMEIEKLSEENKKLREKEQKHEDMLFQLASKPTVSNTTNNNTSKKTKNLIISDWSQETIKSKVENNFTLEHLEDGIKGVARFTRDYIIKDENGAKTLICSDPSRMIFKYKDAEGVIQKDVKAIKLKNAIKEPIIKKSGEIFTTETSKLFDVLVAIPDGGDTETTQAKMDNLSENLQQVKKIDENVETYAKELVLCVSD